MRKRVRPLDALFPRTRQAILAATLIHGDRWWYLSDLARHLGTAPSSLQRELVRLVSAGILLARHDGNRTYYKADSKNPLYPELRRLFEKTSGVVGVLQRTVFSETGPRVVAAFVHGSVARGDADSASDIDLFVVGRVTQLGLSSGLRSAERQLGREINAVVFSPKEFAERVRAGNHFVTAVLDDEKMFVVGSQHDLEAAARGRHRAGARADAPGN